MITGVLELVILDEKHGTPRHGDSEFWTVAHGVDAGDEIVRFIAEYVTLNRYSKCFIRHNETIKGHLYLKTKEILKLQSVLVMLLPPTREEIAEGIENGVITGTGVARFILNACERPLVVKYHLVGRQKLISKVEIDVPLSMLREAASAIDELSVERLSNLRN